VFSLSLSLSLSLSNKYSLSSGLSTRIHEKRRNTVVALIRLLAQYESNRINQTGNTIYSGITDEAKGGQSALNTCPAIVAPVERLHQPVPVSKDLCLVVTTHRMV
jgi:hypothetical protein